MIGEYKAVLNGCSLRFYAGGRARERRLTERRGTRKGKRRIEGGFID